LFTAKGGFIANQPIEINARIYNVKGIKALEYFGKEYDSFDVIWQDSEMYPIQIGNISPIPLTGSVSISSNTCNGKSKVIFKLPGSYRFNIIYHRTGESTDSHYKPQDNDGGDFVKTIYVSPPEVFSQIKGNNITRGLSLFVLSITLFNFLTATWKLNNENNLSNSKTKN